LIQWPRGGGHESAFGGGVTVTACPLLPSRATSDAASSTPSVGADAAASSFALLLGDLIGVLSEAGIVPGVPQTANRPAGAREVTVRGDDTAKGLAAYTAAGSPEKAVVDLPEAAAPGKPQTAGPASSLAVLEHTPPEDAGRAKAGGEGSSDEAKDEPKQVPKESQPALVNPAGTVAPAPQAPLTLIFTPELNPANDKGAEKRTDPPSESTSETDSVQAGCSSPVTVARALSEADVALDAGLRASLKLRDAVPKASEKLVPSPVPRGREGGSEDSLDLAFAAHLQPKVEKRGEPQPLSPASSPKRNIATSSSLSQIPAVAPEGNTRREPDSRDRERKPGTERSDGPTRPVVTPSETVGDDGRIPVLHASPVASPAHVGATFATSPVPTPQSTVNVGSERQAATSAMSQETAEPTPPPANPPQSTISIRLGEEGQDRVDVRLQERQGAIQVVVRSSNSNLTASLRGDLNDLVSRLEGRGYQTETWTPTGNVARPTEPSGQDPRQDGSQTGGQDGKHGSNQRNQGHSGGGRRDPDDGRPAWMEEFETTVRSKKGLSL
jgi:hypothetical protein